MAAPTPGICLLCGGPADEHYPYTCTPCVDRWLNGYRITDEQADRAAALFAQVKAS